MSNPDSPNTLVFPNGEPLNPARRKSNSRSRRFLALTLILTAIAASSLTYAGIHFTNKNSTTRSQILDMGAQYLSERELVRQVSTLKQEMYWMGPVGKSVYTSIIDSDGVGIVLYWPQGTSIMNFNMPRRVVRTYPNFSLYAMNSHPLNLPEDMRTLEIPNGKMAYGLKTMDYQTFFLTNGKIIEVHYAVMKTPAEMRTEAALLALID